MAPGGRQGGYEYVYMVYLTNRNHPQISTSLHVYTELCIVQLSIFGVLYMELDARYTVRDFVAIFCR